MELFIKLCNFKKKKQQRQHNNQSILVNYAVEML